MSVEWTIVPGQTLRRSEIHDVYGGGRRGGMEPSAKTPNVLLFTSVAGAEFGYDFDGWHSDGTFHYTGEGQLGDQVMTHGNRAVRDHVNDGRAIRLFEKTGTSATYVGEFSAPDESHVLLDEAPDLAGQKRAVFVFRLKPVGEYWLNQDHVAPPQTLYSVIPIEKSDVDEYIVLRAPSEPIVGLRREAALVNEYISWLANTNSGTVERQSIPTAAGHLMYTDIFVRPSLELIEAKSSASRDHIRAALGQILDYARYVDHGTLAVLTPTKPAHDLISLLIAHNIHCIWREGAGHFEREGPLNAWN